MSLIGLERNYCQSKIMDSDSFIGYASVYVLKDLVLLYVPVYPIARFFECSFGFDGLRKLCHEHVRHSFVKVQLHLLSSLIKRLIESNLITQEDLADSALDERRRRRPEGRLFVQETLIPRRSPRYPRPPIRFRYR